MSFGEGSLTTITGLAGRILAGLSPVTLAEDCLARIEAGNDQIRAMIHVDVPAVLSAARQAEREIREGRWRGPLHGVPVAVKDNFDVAGWPTTLGSRLFGQNPAEQTADCLGRLQAAGAVLIGKTNMHELCAGGHANPWFGKVRNPLNPDHGTGGTSSGAAAAVAAGFCVAAIGTDTGGSNRSPAAATGLYGCKPGASLISTRGVRAMAPSLDTVGVLSRSVADTKLLAEALSGRKLGTQGAAARIRIALCPELAGAAVDAAVLAAIRDWLDRPEVDLVEIDYPCSDELRDAGLTILLHEFAVGHAAPILANPDLVGAAVRGFLDLALAISPDSYRNALATRERHLHRMPLALNGIDALVMPTCPGLAPRIEDEMTCVNGEWIPWGPAGGNFRRWANMLDMPTLAIPLPICGTLPASVQLSVLRGQDARLFDLAAALTQD